MNSDPWYDPLAEVWQRQPTPKPKVTAQQILQQVREAEQTWVDEWEATERTYFGLAAAFLLPVTMEIARPNFDWTNVFLNLCFVWLAAVAFVFRLRRRRARRHFGQDLLSHFAEAEALLHERNRFYTVMLWCSPLLPLALGDFLWILFPGQRLVAGIGVVLGGAGTVWLVRYQRRLGQADLAKKFAELEAKRRALAALGADETSPLDPAK